MKTSMLLITLILVTACSSPSNDSNAPAAATQAPATASTPADTASTQEAAAAATTASASGTVESVDIAAKTVTIAHGPVDALKWPAMTMTFKAPNADLASFKQGDRIDFEFASTGMDGTITKITRR